MSVEMVHSHTIQVQVITYTGPSSSEVRAHFTAGTGINISEGEVSIPQSIATTDSVTFSSVTADLTGDVTGQVSDISNHDTGSLTEGSNLYYTDTRARSAVSVTDVSGDGSLAYDSSTGVITYTGPSATEVRSHFSAGTGITIAEGEVSIPQSIATTDSVTFSSVTADLTGDVTGTVSDISNHDTGSLSEGSNLYYTDTRARSSVSVTDVSGDGSLSYDSSTGVITYTGPSSSEVRAHFSAGTGITISEGEVSIPQSIATTDSVTFQCDCGSHR